MSVRTLIEAEGPVAITLIKGKKKKVTGTFRLHCIPSSPLPAPSPPHPTSLFVRKAPPRIIPRSFGPPPYSTVSNYETFDSPSSPPFLPRVTSAPASSSPSSLGSSSFSSSSLNSSSSSTPRPPSIYSPPSSPEEEELSCETGYSPAGIPSTTLQQIRSSSRPVCPAAPPKRQPPPPPSAFKPAQATPSGPPSRNPPAPPAQNVQRPSRPPPAKPPSLSQQQRPSEPALAPSSRTPSRPPISVYYSCPQIDVTQSAPMRAPAHYHANAVPPSM